jgi:hypothetical protein
MMRRVRDLIVELSMIVALGFALALAIPQANAEMISTERAQAGDERGRVKAMIERPEMTQALQKMGIAPGTAAARIDAMSDAEVSQLAGRLDALPAGGRLSNEELLLIIIIVLLLVILI